jgi:hypothetical protein
MAGAHEAGGAEPTADGTLSATERKALLKRTVVDLTREERARIRRRGEFDTLLVRGSTVDHRLHFVVLIMLVALALGASQLVTAGPGLIAALAVPCLYVLFWLFLTLTGGEELERISVDEQGKIGSVKSGRDRETQGDFVRVAIPVALIAFSGWIAVGLIHDIAIPPPPNCDAPTTKEHPDACLSIPNIAVLAQATLPPQRTAPAPVVRTAPPDAATPKASASPAAGPSPAASTAPGTSTGAPQPGEGAFSVEVTMVLERMVRSFQLVIALVVLLGSIWFFRRMVTGRWVGFIRPVKHRLSDE